MGIEHVAPLIEADNRRIVMQATWGHLAPEKNKTYRGRIVFVCGIYDSGDLNPTIIFDELKRKDGKKLLSSPWYYDAVHEFLKELVWKPARRYPKETPAAPGVGIVYEWVGSFRNYVWNGKVRKIYDANIPAVRPSDIDTRVRRAARVISNQTYSLPPDPFRVAAIIREKVINPIQSPAAIPQRGQRIKT